MKFLRISFAIIVLLIVICIVAMASLVMFIDLNKLKPVLADEVQKRTGYILTVDGDLSWSFYPRLSVSIKHMSLREPNQTQPFIDLNNIKMAAKLSILLSAGKNPTGYLYIDQVHLGHLNVSHVSVDLHWQNKVLTLQPINAAVYQGTLAGIAHGRFDDGAPQWDWDVTFENIQLQPVLADLNPGSKLKLSGLGQLKLTMSTQGKDRASMMNHLNGSSEIKITKGAIDGININYLIQTANAVINKQSLPSPDNLQQTAFDEMSGTAIVKQGVATNHFVLLAPGFTANADGSLNLNNNTIDMNLNVKPLQNNTPAQAGKEWTVPILVQGDLTHPSINLDMSNIRGMIIKQEIDKVKEKARQIIKEHLSGKTATFLQNLLNG